MGSCPDTDIDPKTEGHIDDHHKDIKLIESKRKKKKRERKFYIGLLSKLLTMNTCT